MRETILVREWYRKHMAKFGFFRNVGALSGSRVLVVLLQFAALPVIARYLTTAEFGLVALAMSVVVFCQTLSDAGLGRSLIRQPIYDRAEWSSVFWFLAAVGLGLGALVVLVSGPLAALFGAPELRPLLQVFGVMPFLSAVTAIPAAFMEKHNRFAPLATVRLGSALAGLAIAVVLAVAGAGAWALVAQQISVAAIDLVAIWLLSNFRPAAALRANDLERHYGFARDNIGVSLLFTAQRQLPVMLIGYVLGSSTLGLYAMSQRLLRLPLMGFSGPFSQVVYVRMARVQAEPARVGDLYVESVRAMALVVLPPMLLVAAIGEQTFSLLFSEAWRQSGLVYALAAPGVALEVATSAAGVAFQATGQTGIRLRMAAERAVLRTTAIALAIPFGIEAAALAITAFALLYLPRFWAYLKRAVPFSEVTALKALIGPSLASLAGGVALALWLPAETGIAGLLLWLLSALLAAWLLAAALQPRALHRCAAILNG
ncbi:MAG: lipopolysaccharide biosynthesis protein [Pseudomonadota bacterium]